MSDARPRILAETLAAFLDAAPGRVRKRLDREPAAANEWAWERTEQGWTIAAGDERVSLLIEAEALRDVSRASCTCLLSPHCFHVLACVTLLTVDVRAQEAAAGEGTADPRSDASSNEDEADDSNANASQEALVEVTAPMREAALKVREATRSLLAVGARGAGTLVQSSLLRAGHQCRAAELPTLGNAALRIADGVRALRVQDDDADAEALRLDLVTMLEGAVRISTGERVDESFVGTSRREYRPSRVNRLEGWFAEPVLTRSGYAGVCVRFFAPSGETYQVLDLRPGDSQLILQAYAGGIDLGTTVESGRDLCRKTLLVQRLGVSADGRLGRGTATRWAMQGTSNFDGGAASRLFEVPLARQIEAVFANATLPEERRTGGWDCVAFEARILGAHGASVLAEVAGSSHPWRLRIAIDRPELPFRENLELLARCPGLRLRCVGRMRIDAAGEVDLLAAGPVRDRIEAADREPTDSAERSAVEPSGPRLCLPEEWKGKCNLGLDRLHQRHFEGIERWATQTALHAESAAAVADDGLAPLARRLDALALGGWRAIPNVESASHRRDASMLNAQGQSAGATLLRRLGESAASLAINRSASGTERDVSPYSLEKTTLACSLYLTAARVAFHRERWLERVQEA